MSGVPVPQTRPGVPSAVLLGATALWGASFPVTKIALEHASPAATMVGRFAIAALVLGVVTVLRRARPKAQTVRLGAGLGVVMGVGMVAQTAGLEQTPAGVAGLLSGLVLVLVPLLALLVGQPIRPAAGWAIASAAAGVLILAGPVSLSGAGPGIALSLLAVATFAVHIVGLSRVPTGVDPVGLTGVQAAVAAVVAAAAGAIGGQPLLPHDPAAWWAVLALAVGATCLGLGAQSWAQPRLSAQAAAVLMAGEPLTAAALATLLLGEPVTAGLLVGGALVVASMVVVQLQQAPPQQEPSPDEASARTTSGEGLAPVCSGSTGL